MKYWAVMEFLTPQRTDRFGVAAFVESREEVIDVVRVRLSVVGHRLDQLFKQCAHRDLSFVRNPLCSPISVIISFYNYLFHTLKLTAKSGRVKVHGSGQVGRHELHKESRVRDEDQMIKTCGLSFYDSTQKLY
jgi:hypothetical protein